MTPERWREVKSWFSDVTNASETERQRILADLESRDPELAREVKRLVSEFQEAGSFLDSPIVAAREMMTLLPILGRVEPGQVLAGRFEIRRRIGQGGMGQVFEALDRELGTVVALKTLGGMQPLDEAARSRLGREVLAARGVTDSNVCRTFDYGTHQSDHGVIPFFTMEYLDGESLAERLGRDGAMAESEARGVAEQMAAALDAAHVAGVIHRDFKPGNVMLVPQSGRTRVVVTDFGIASVSLAGPMGTQTGTAELRGTLAYMAPEVLAGEPATTASDIYSFGLTLYEMTTGANPVAAANPFASAVRRATTDVASPRDRVPALSREWADSVLACVERDPKLRPRTAGEALKADRRRIPGASLRPLLRNWRRPAAAIGLLGILLASLPSVVRYIREGTHIAAGGTVMVRNVENLTGDPELSGATDLLRHQLTQSAYLNVLDRDSLASAAARMGNKPATDAIAAREIAIRAGCAMAIFANLTRLGSDLELRVRVERLSATPEAAAASRDRTWTVVGKSELMGAFGQAASWIRSMVGESDDEIAKRNRPPEDVTTSSWNALDLFAQAEALQAAGRSEDAIGLLKRGTEFDPQFTLAYMRMGDIRLGQRLYDEGEEWWQKALSILGSRRLSEREELRIRSMYAGDTGDFRECERVYRTFALRFPNDSYARERHGLALSQLDRLDEADSEIRAAEKLSPNQWLMPASLSKVALWAGRYDEALEAAVRLQTMGQSGWAECIRGQVAFLRGDLQAARAAFEKLASSREGIWRSRGPLILASFEAELGRFRAAIEVLDRSIGRDLDSSLKPDIAIRLLAKAWLHARLGRRTESLLDAEQALGADSGAQTRMQAGVLFARLGSLERARRIRTSFDDKARFGVNARAPHLLDGEIALASGKPDAAAAAFQRAHALEPPAKHQEPLARALVQSGDLTQALAVYRQMLARPGHLWVTPDQDWPGIWMDAVAVEATLAGHLREDALASEARSLLSRYRENAESDSLLKVVLP